MFQALSDQVKAALVPLKALPFTSKVLVVAFYAVVHVVVRLFW